MAGLGKYNTLKVVKILDFGVYLDGGNLGEILLPIKQVPPFTQIDDEIEVFLYNDSEDRLIATCKEPFATVDQFAVLRVQDLNKTGAWLDWGLEKNLLVPFREQKQNMEQGKSYLVYIYVDVESKRIVASSKLDKFLDNTPAEYTVGQQVDLLISNKSDIGYVAIINNQHSGILYANEVFRKIERGQRLTGYIKKIREDEKIDLSLDKPGYQKIDAMSEVVLNKLKQSGGVLNVSDKTPPTHIAALFGFSKKSFKKAIGQLYKQKLIVINDDNITLI